MADMDRTGPRVSVGMPVFNAERYIEEALESILSQSFEDFELVISDNASTDRTPEICESHAAKDARIKYFRNPKNYGVVHNFNNAFRLSAGEYFKWAASDDVCGRDYLLRAVEILDQDPSVVLVWAKTVGIDENGRRVPMEYEISDLNSPLSVYSPDPVVRFRKLLRNFWWVDGPFYGVMRSSVLGSTRWVHPPHPSGDQILLAELSLKGRFYEIPEELFYSRVHAGKTSRRHGSFRQRVVLGDQTVGGRGLLVVWRGLRIYPRRISMYVSAISRGPVPVAKKLKCYWEIARAVVQWVILRSRQVWAVSLLGHGRDERHRL
jgi:glycosyltransferase involved in cell wall biosynthesis